MAPLCLLLVLVCGTVASSISDTEGDKGNDRPSRRHPPPVASFLKSLNAPQTRRSEGEPARLAAKEAGGAFSSHHGAVPHRREKRHLPQVIAKRSCTRGTCQTKHHLNHSSGKEHSNTIPGDPYGYGRRRRFLLARRAALRLDPASSDQHKSGLVGQGA
ncbi:uncharacterized protein LOC144767567 [Lissotriton helveticus]